MFDTIYHYLTNFIRSWDEMSYVFVICVFFIISLMLMRSFLKANKDSPTRVYRISALIGVALCLVAIVGIKIIR